MAAPPHLPKVMPIMSIRFAAPKLSRKRLLAAQIQRLRKQAANDNHGTADADAAIRRALELFGVHGMGAAEVARGAAERAAFRGDTAAFQVWRDVCANLDRRVARELDALVLQIS